MNLPELLGNSPQIDGCCCTASMQKNSRILFSENVVIGQSSSKCPGLSVRTVNLNKAYKFAVVFAHKGIDELWNCASMICRLPVGSNKQRLTEHVSKLCKSSHYHLRNISKIRKYLDENSTEKLVHAFVSSKLNYCNALLIGLPKYQIDRLQSVLNTCILLCIFFCFLLFL